MLQSLINQITIDCLLNREAMEKLLMKQREMQINKEEFNFYKQRIYDLFKDLINESISSDIPPDLKYAFDTFIKTSIDYFKLVDNNDLLQVNFNDIDAPLETCSEQTEDDSINIVSNNEADKLLMRYVKMDVPTLDKYVKRTYVKKKDNIILPKSREVDIMNPELKNKVFKKE